MVFSDEELERYARHIVLREVGGPGQQKLKAARVVVIGAGGLGAPVLLYLAAAGVGYIWVVDDDVVSRANLQRQIVFGEADIGRPKVEAAAQRLQGMNSNVVVDPVCGRLTPQTAGQLLDGIDLVIDGCDNFATRYGANEAAVAAQVPLLSGALSQWEGQVALFDPSQGGPCYACVFPQAPAAGLAPSCAEAGVVGALAGVIGSMMASEAVKHIVGAGQSLVGQLLIHDCLWSESRRMSVSRRADCAVCSGTAGSP